MSIIFFFFSSDDPLFIHFLSWRISFRTMNIWITMVSFFFPFIILEYFSFFCTIFFYHFHISLLFTVLEWWCFFCLSIHYFSIQAYSLYIWFFSLTRIIRQDAHTLPLDQAYLSKFLPSFLSIIAHCVGENNRQQWCDFVPSH